MEIIKKALKLFVYNKQLMNQSQVKHKFALVLLLGKLLL